MPAFSSPHTTGKCALVKQNPAQAVIAMAFVLKSTDCSTLLVLYFTIYLSIFICSARSIKHQLVTTAAGVENRGLQCGAHPTCWASLISFSMTLFGCCTPGNSLAYPQRAQPTPFVSSVQHFDFTLPGAPNEDVTIKFLCSLSWWPYEAPVASIQHQYTPNQVMWS